MRTFFSWFRSLRQFLASTYRELPRITWPTREQTIRLTSIVVGVCLVLGAILALGDYGLGQLLDLLIG